jgi:hypothetical protein
MRSFFFKLLFGASLICASQNLQAGIIWNESLNGDLSSNPGAPTALNFTNGGNTVIGTLSQPAGDLRDYMTFTIGPNQFLTGLTLDSYVADGAGFQGFNAGNTSFVPGVDPSSNFLGLEFVIVDFVGTDMLPLLADTSSGYGHVGFTIPLGQGTYSYLIQEITTGQSTAYQMTFSVVPEPSAIGLCCLTAALSFVRRRRSS